MTVQAIDAQGLSSELPTSSARQRHFSSCSLMAYPSSSPTTSIFLFYNKYRYRKDERVRAESDQGAHVSCRYRIGHASTHCLWDTAMGSWKARKGTDSSECTSSQDSCSRRNTRTIARFCQASSRPKHVRRPATQTSTSHPDVDSRGARSARGRSRGICDDDLVCLCAPADILSTKPARATSHDSRVHTRRGVRMGRIPRPRRPPAQPGQARAKSALPTPPPPPPPPCCRTTRSAPHARPLRTGPRSPPRAPPCGRHDQDVGMELASRLRRQRGMAPPARGTLSRRA